MSKKVSFLCSCILKNNEVLFDLFVRFAFGRGKLDGQREKILPMASSGKDWKRISAECLMSPDDLVGGGTEL